MHRRVLVADDDESSRETLGHFLKLAGHDFVLVGDGQTAWELLKEGISFDLVMSDYQMPGMDGLELLRRVRTDRRLAHIPFTLMSGAMTISSEDKTLLADVCKELGATFALRPLDYESLIVQVLGPKREMDDS